MSTPEEIQSGTQSDQPRDAVAAIGQLRVLVCGLGAGLLLVSLLLSAFVLKQNRDLAAVTNNRQHQLAQLQVQQKPLFNLMSKLAEYSAGKPELTAIFTRHGLQFAPTGAPGQPAPALQR